VKLLPRLGNEDEFAVVIGLNFSQKPVLSILVTSGGTHAQLEELFPHQRTAERNLGHATFYKIEVIHQPNSPTPRKFATTESKIVAWAAMNFHYFAWLKVGFVGGAPDGVQSKLRMAGVLGVVWVICAFCNLGFFFLGNTSRLELPEA